MNLDTVQVWWDGLPPSRREDLARKCRPRIAAMVAEPFDEKRLLNRLEAEALSREIGYFADLSAYSDDEPALPSKEIMRDALHKAFAEG